MDIEISKHGGFLKLKGDGGVVYLLISEIVRVYTPDDLGETKGAEITLRNGHKFELQQTAEEVIECINPQKQSVDLQALL